MRFFINFPWIPSTVYKCTCKSTRHNCNDNQCSQRAWDCVYMRHQTIEASTCVVNVHAHISGGCTWLYELHVHHWPHLQPHADPYQISLQYRFCCWISGQCEQMGFLSSHHKKDAKLRFGCTSNSAQVWCFVGLIDLGLRLPSFNCGYFLLWISRIV